MITNVNSRDTNAFVSKINHDIIRRTFVTNNATRTFVSRRLRVKRNAEMCAASIDERKNESKTRSGNDSD